MDGQDLNPNVVLTADVSQYDQAMSSSAKTTDDLAKSVDTLAGKLNSLAKSAGKISLGVAAADVATITAATAAWASYENQMNRLQAQSAIVTRGMEQQDRVMKVYTKSVNDLRKTYGTSTGEGAQLVESISKLTENKTQRDLGNIAKIFTDMSKATGENSTGLATSVLGLQKVMGTAISSSTTRKYADQVTYLSQQTSLSAQGLTDFAAQIAPVGRLLDLNQTQITGVATAFAKAGQDGYTAANAFNQIVSNVAQATQSGSPDLAKYANLIGVTKDHFKEMAGSEKILQIFERLNTMGPRAVTELNRLGLDGMRTMRAITAMSNQTGGLRSAISEAEYGATSNSAATGATASMKGMYDELAKIREEAKMIAELFAEKFGPAMASALQGVEALASGFRNMMEGPLGDVIQGVAVLGGSVAALAGGLLVSAGPLAQMATAALLLRGAGFMGLREGFRGASGVGRDGSPTTPGGFLGKTGQQVADRGSWFQRGMYNAGASTGGFFGGMRGTGESSGMGARVAAAPINAGAWGMRNILSSIYTPLGFKGYNDPTQRQRMFQNPVSPWGRLFGSDETKAAGRAASESMQANRVAREAGALSGAFRNITTSTGFFAKSMASAAANTAVLGSKLAMAGIGKIGVGNLAGAAGLGLMASGVADDTGYGNTITYGLMGSFMGPMGAAAGTAAGLYADATAGQKKLGILATEYTDAQEMGAGLQERYGTYKDATKVYEETMKDLVGEDQARGPKGIVLDWKNKIERWFGDSDSEEARDTYEKSVGNWDYEVAALEKIAKAMNIPLSNDYVTRLGELDEVAARIKPRLDEMNMSFEDLAESYKLNEQNMDGPFGSFSRIFESIVQPNLANGLWDRISGINSSGRNFIQSEDVQRALNEPGNVNAQYEAVNSQYAGDLRRGLSYRQIVNQRGNLLAGIGDADSPEYAINSAILGQARQDLSYQMPFMGRTRGYQVQANLFQDQANLTSGDPAQMEKMQAATQEFMAATVAQVQYFQQRLLQQEQYELGVSRGFEDFAIQRERMDESYELQRSRAQDDFALQRKYQEEDYQLSRRRAEADFQRGQQRGTESYQRSLKRSFFDFNLSRKRQEQDYQRQVQLMVEQSAQTMYNIYDRVQVQRTSSASYLLFNSNDQLQRMREQNNNLDTARSLGLDDETIQQLGLTKAENAQQLARLVQDMQNDPKMAKELNRAIRQRMKAARELVTDESSKEWEEFQRQYRIAMRRATNDFERSVARSHKDFQIQMEQMEDDFRRSMSRQADDYEKAQDRQQEAFSKSMNRSAEDYAKATDHMVSDFNKSMRRAQEDMDLMSREITGSMIEILTRATQKLDGETGKQARSMLRTFRTLKRELGGAGNDIMMTMSNIFGFKFTPKDIVSAPGGGGGGVRQPNNSGMGPQNSFAEGGTLPGRSIGRDNMHFYSPDHGNLSLAGGEAIMVPEWVDKVGGPEAVKRMNHLARTGRAFAGGGMIPAAGEWNEHTSGYPWARWAGDINIPGSGDYGNPVRAWKDGIVAAVTSLTTSYGNHIRVNHPATDEQTLYAHLSKMLVTPGDSVARGGLLGHVGSTGKSSGPHLHFEIKGGAGPIQTGGSSTTGLSDILKDFYPDVEAAAADVQLNGGLFERGYWSKQLNKMARTAWRQNVAAQSKSNGSVLDAPPTSAGSNQDIVRDAMRQHGWNQWPSLYQLVQQESSFNNTAQNPTSTAYGLFQFLDSTWGTVGGTKTSDPHLQSEYGMRYIKNRYDDPNSAWGFHQQNGWYGEGGVFADPQVIGVGERGPEMVLPLNDRGAAFIADLMQKTSVGLDGRNGRVQGSTPVVAHTVNSYQIDRSTTFTGAITVQANNPNELIQQLRQRQRVMALSQASLGGART